MTKKKEETVEITSEAVERKFEVSILLTEQGEISVDSNVGTIPTLDILQRASRTVLNQHIKDIYDPQKEEDVN